MLYALFRIGAAKQIAKKAKTMAMVDFMIERICVSIKANVSNEEIESTVY